MCYTNLQLTYLLTYLLRKQLTNPHCTGSVQAAAATPVSPWLSAGISVEGCVLSAVNCARDEK